MPADTTYPGVYVGELSTSVGTVTPVSTATAAFVGYTRRGPLNQPVRITSFAEYERYFGALGGHGAGGWGNGLRILINHNTRENFDLYVVNAVGRGREAFPNLSMDPDDDRFAPTVINADSKLIRAEAVGRDRPEQSGTISREFEREL